MLYINFSMCNWRLGVLGTNMVNALICLVFKMMCLLQETNAGSTTLFTIMAGYRGAVDPDKNLIAPETSTTNRAECTLKCHLNGGCTSLNFISAISGPSVCQLLNDKDDDPIRTGNSNDMYALVKNRQPVVPVDPNQCDSNPCTNGGTCVDGENEYTCQCLPEFIGTNCDQYSPNIYVFGGNIAPGATAYSDAFYKINVATYTTDTYSLTGYGTDFQGRLMSSIALNDSILFYSFNGPSWEDKYGIFSIADSSITTISTIPTGYFCNECHALVVLVGNTLVNCGKGVSNGKCVLHELSTGQTDVVDLPDNKNGACAVAISDTEMLWLGGDTNSVLSVNVVSKDYTAHATRNLPLTSGCAMYDADTMVMCGGFSGGALSTCHKLTVSSMQWSGMVSLQVARLNHRLIKVFGHLLAIGGMDSSYQLTTNMEWYDGSAWTESNDVALPIALADFAVVVHH